MKYFPIGRGTFKGIINDLNVYHYDELDSFIKTSNSSKAGMWGNSSRVVDFRITDFNIQKNNWASEKEENSSLTFHFLKHKVLATHYSILAPPHIENFPQNWIIEGSNDDKKWYLIDTVNKSLYLTGKLYSHTYKLDVNSIFSSFRITQIGGNSNGNYYFHISRFELFGTISELEERECFLPYRCTKDIKQHRYSLLILLCSLIHS